MFQAEVVEKMTTHILCQITFPLNRAVYEIMWKSIREWDGPQMTIWRMRISCWIPKATNTHTGCLMLIAFTLQQWLHERTSVLRYTYIVCLVCFLHPFTAGRNKSLRLITVRIVHGTKACVILLTSSSTLLKFWGFHSRC